MIHRIAGNTLLCCAVLTALSCTPSRKEESSVKTQIERFAPVTLTGDVARLSPGDREALQKLVEAARVMDTLYLRQVWSGAQALRERLVADTTPEGALRLRYFDINMSPWSGLDHEAPFIDGVPPKPPQANYYPADMTSGEFTAWVTSLPDDQQRAATGFFTLIRRNPAGKLTVVPYSVEYRDLLERAATLLREAAGSTDNASLKRFLALRADAFLSNDYYQSDVAWMDLDSPIEPTIGPYEVYLDQLFNYKAAFEAFITLRNDGETAKLARFSAELQEVENHLPIEPGYRNPRLGAMAPIRVVDEVALGGEARAGVQTAAFNLPNDERVTQEKGSKRVMLKNVQEAKFRTILTPIADRVIDPAQRPDVAFEPFFTHILAHELMHGLGPHAITVGGKPTTVRQAMKELSSAIEEAKADISGLFMLQHLIERGTVDPSMERQMYVTFLAGMFRSMRFGIREAHGRGMALQFSFLMQEGAIRHDEAAGTFAVVPERMKQAVLALTREIMTIQAKGDYAAAKALLDKYAVEHPAMQKALSRLTDIPVDIVPIFSLKQ
jgi:hypothetical protein